MTAIATAWLLLSLLLAGFARMASRRLAVLSLPAAAALAALTIYLPLGKPNPIRPPKGSYVVVGLDIQENVAVDVLLKGADGVTTFYRLPYSNNEASALQNAQADADAEGGAVQVTVGGEGETTVGVNRPPARVKPAQ